MNRFDAQQIIENAAKRVRDAVADFQLEHSVHPTALMAGTDFQSPIIAAFSQLIQTGTPKPEAMKRCHITLDESSGQFAFLGFPIIGTGRPGERIAPALVDLDYLKPQPAPAA